MTNDNDDPDKRIAEARAKYRQERDLRLGAPAGRTDIALTGARKRFVDDPFQEVVERAPVEDEVDAVCIGAGFAGLLVGANLKQAGITRVRLIDSAGDVGGVWYWNRYPEAKCDVESLCYMPLLEETGYVPSQKYAAQPEIHEHARRIARHFDLYDLALFHTTVTEIRWHEDEGHWTVRTDRGDNIRAAHVIIGIGPMNTVKIPDIPGIDTFKGKTFHTSRWDYDYTGGAPNDPALSKLHDKSVGFIGTGATALQAVAPLAESAKQLFLFQRTPSTVGIRGNRPIDPSEVRDLAPGWQKRRQENFTAIWAGAAVDEDLVQDGWTYICKELYRSPRYEGLSPAEKQAERERVDFDLMEEVRARIASIVRDPATAEGLKPYYNYFCKRPGWHDEYLAAFNLPSVSLVDTHGKGIERIYEGGVVVEGREYPLDCLIFGTGFVTETTGKLRLGFDVIGRDGVTLTEKWKDGMTTLHGLMVSQFPNLFIIPGVNSQAVVTVNVVHMTQEYAHQIAYVVRSIRERGMRVFNLSADAEKAWVDTILARRIDDAAFLEACTPGRNNYEGNTKARPRQNTVFGGGPIEYFGLLKAWRDSGDLPGLELSHSADSAQSAPRSEKANA